MAQAAQAALVAIVLSCGLCIAALLAVLYVLHLKSQEQKGAAAKAEVGIQSVCTECCSSKNELCMQTAVQRARPAV